MTDMSNHTSIERPSEKSFGIVFSIVFLLIAGYPLIDAAGIRIWSFVVSLSLFLIALLAPRILALPNKLWFNFGLLVGSFVSPFAMGLIYFSTVLPTGLIIRSLGKDLLKQKLDKNAPSYWIKRSDPMGSMKNQF